MSTKYRFGTLKDIILYMMRVRDPSQKMGLKIGVGGRRGFDCGSRRTANLGGDRLIRTPIIILEG